MGEKRIMCRPLLAAGSRPIAHTNQHADVSVHVENYHKQCAYQLVVTSVSGYPSSNLYLYYIVYNAATSTASLLPRLSLRCSVGTAEVSSE